MLFDGDVHGFIDSYFYFVRSIEMKWRQLCSVTTRAPHDYLNPHPRSSNPSRESFDNSASFVFVLPMGLSRMPLSLVPVDEDFDFLAKGRSEAYGPRVVSEPIWTMGPRLINNGRKVAIEAAMIPRFISSLS